MKTIIINTPGPRGPQGPPGVPSTGTFTGSFSGSFIGDGSGLENVPASGVVGLNLSRISTGSFTASLSANGGLTVNTHITASGDISSSGTVTGLTGSFDHLITLGDTIEFTSTSRSKLGSLSFDTTDGLQVKDAAGSRTKLKADLIDSRIITASGNVLVQNDLTVLGTGSFTHFVTTYESSSIIYASGSTKFGDTMDDTHLRTGSMSITGSLIVTGGTLTGDGSGLTNVFEGTAASQSISTRLTTQETKTTFSGSFQGNGSGLTSIPASGIVGLNLSQIADGTATASISETNGFNVNTDSKITGSLTVSGSAHNFIGPTTFDLSAGGLTLANSVGGNIYMSTTYNSEFRVFDVRRNNGNYTGIKLLMNKHSPGAGALEIYHGGTSKYVDLNTNTNYLLSNTRFGANSGTAAAKVDIVGNLNVTTDITASGNILVSDSGSGIIVNSGSLNVKRSAASANIATFTPLTSAGRVEINDAEVKVTDTQYGYTAGRLYSSINRTGEFSLHYWSGIAGVYIQGNANEGGSTWQQNFIGGGLHVGSRKTAGANAVAHAFSVNGPSQLTGSLAVIGQVSASSYIGDGSGLTGLGGAYGISNSNGVYTYYGTLSASIAAASAGDVVEVFADVVETNPVTILFKNGVNIQGNGHSYTLDHTGSQAAFADYLSTETSGTSISSSIHNLRIDRINGDSSTGLRAATIFINNDTANHDTFLDLRGSEISNNTSDTYFCSYKHGRVLGGKFIGNHSGRYFLSGAQVQYTGTHNVTDVYCESEDGYAQVDDAGDSTFVSRNNTAALVTQGDFVGCTFVSNATSPAFNGAAVVQSTSISGAKLKNCVAWCNGSGTTAIYGVAWIENCSVVNARYYALNYAIDTGGAQSFTLLNSSVYSNAGSAIKIQDGSNTGTLRILNNTIHNDRYSSYGAYPTIYLQGWDNSDNLIANNTIVHGGPYKAGNLANAIEVHSGGGSNYTFNIVNNTIKVSQHDAFCISSSAAVAPNIVYAQNTFEGANVPVAPSITQALTNVPDAQGNIHVTSSLDNSRIYSGSFSGSYVGDGSGLTGVEPFPFTGDAQITGSLTFSGSLIDFRDAASVLLPESTVPLINPQVEYFTTTAITSSGTTVPLPGDLTFISSSTFEYLEIFINGLRLRYDIDFAPQSTGSVKYFVSLPSGTEVTYKSLNRP